MTLQKKQFKCRDQFTSLSKKYFRLLNKGQDIDQVREKMNAVSAKFYRIQKFIDIGSKIRKLELH